MGLQIRVRHALGQRVIELPDRAVDRPLVVGRAANAEVQVPSVTVAPKHCTCSSTTGTGPCGTWRRCRPDVRQRRAGRWVAVPADRGRGRAGGGPGVAGDRRRPGRRRRRPHRVRRDRRGRRRRVRTRPADCRCAGVDMGYPAPGTPAPAGFARRGMASPGTPRPAGTGYRRAAGHAGPG